MLIVLTLAPIARSPVAPVAAHMNIVPASVHLINAVEPLASEYSYSLVVNLTDCLYFSSQ
jgi:hypothetical protein